MSLGAAAVLAVSALYANPAIAAKAEAVVQDREGRPIGTVSATDTASGQVLVTISLRGVPEGVHGVHLHESGDCSARDFSSAGGHIANGASHGIKSEDGPHPGDLPNLTVRSDGVATLELFLPDLDVRRHLLDSDGAAFVMHAGIDDYQTDPSGDAGGRIACGVFASRP